MTEAEAERMHERQQVLLERVQARFRRERAEHLREIVRDEMERMRREEDAAGRTLNWEIRPMGDSGEISFGDEEGDDELGEGELEFGSQDDAGPRPEHRLVTESRGVAEKLMEEFTLRKLIPAGSSVEHPLVQLATSSFKASLKLDAVLNGKQFPPPLPVTALAIVLLKRARDHFDDARAALDDAVEQELADRTSLLEVRTQLVAYAAETDALVADLRQRLG